MMLLKKSVRESRVDCSRVMVLDGRHADQRICETRGWKTKELSTC